MLINMKKKSANNISNEIIQSSIRKDENFIRDHDIPLVPRIKLESVNEIFKNSDFVLYDSLDQVFGSVVLDMQDSVLKVTDSEGKGLSHEVVISTILKHSNFVQILGYSQTCSPDFISSDKSDYALYEKITGITLAEFLIRLVQGDVLSLHRLRLISSPTFSNAISSLKEYLNQILQALLEVYTKYKFTHYDLHCRNVMLEFNNVKFIDFAYSYAEFENKVYGWSLPDEGIYFSPFWLADILKLAFSSMSVTMNKYESLSSKEEFSSRYQKILDTISVLLRPMTFISEGEEVSDYIALVKTYNLTWNLSPQNFLFEDYVKKVLESV